MIELGTYHIRDRIMTRNLRLQQVDPSQQPNTHLTPCSLSSPEGQGENGMKARKHMDRDSDSLIGETKEVCTI